MINLAFHNDKIFTHCSEPEYTRGIFQSIGFKEFHEYLIMPKADQETPEGKEIFTTGTLFIIQIVINSMKAPWGIL